MAQQHINTGSALGAGDGDSLRIAAIKLQDNFTELYDSDIGSPLSLDNFTGSLQITTESASPATQLALELSSSYDDPFLLYKPSLFCSGTIFLLDPNNEGFALNRNGINANAQLTKKDSIQTFRDTCVFLQATGASGNMSFGVSQDFRGTMVQIRRSAGKNFFSKFIDLNSERANIECFIYGGNASQPVFYTDPTSANQTVQIGGATGGTPGIRLDVLGNTLTDGTPSTHGVKIDNLPTSDPSNSGELYTQTSDQIFGDGGTDKILCIS